MEERFEGVVGSEGRNLFIEVPNDLVVRLGAGRRPHVVVRIDGRIEFSSTVAVYADRSYVPLRRSRREQSGLAAGDPVVVSLKLDEAYGTVDVPQELQDELYEAGLTEVFSAQAPSRRREWSMWVSAAKRPETRVRRMQSVVAQLKDLGS